MSPTDPGQDTGAPGPYASADPKPLPPPPDQNPINQLSTALSAYSDQLQLQDVAQHGPAATDAYLQKKMASSLAPIQKAQQYGQVPLAPHDAFTTPLAPADESKFQSWRNQWAPRDSGADYDLRGAYKAGLLPDEQTGHWLDTYKKPNHPTFSVESQYAGSGNPGHWTGKDHDIYIPGETPNAVSMNPASNPSSLNPFEGGVNSPVGKVLGQGVQLMQRGSSALKNLLSGSTQHIVDETPAKSPKYGNTRNVDQNRQLDILRREGN